MTVEHNYKIESYADLRGADLAGADLRDAKLCCANLSNADLSSAVLRGADLRDAKLCCVNLSNVDLSFSDLSGADLRGADLTGAKLQYCTGNGEEIKNVPGSDYWIAYTDDVLAIGCKHYTKTEWLHFSDAKISVMDDDALEWWRVWKPKLIDLCVL